MEPDAQIPPAASCRSMAEVRAAIDRLDRALVALLAERQGYIEAAARIKGARGEVYDAARVEEVVAKVLSEAARLGLSPEIAEPVWRTLVERSIAHEFAAYDSLRKGA
ncbi:MAG: chorismate mutase [Alphaproteobacteria bacterium]|nr:chorismate mutase [Alphaproteobacteria bacterium]